MKGKLAGVVAFVAAYIAFSFGSDFYREWQASNSVNREMEALREEARAQNPQVPEVVALQETASARAEELINASTSDRERTQRAASTFLGFYLVNQRTRADFCQAEGVNIGGFTREFVSAHSEEYAIAIDTLSMNAAELNQFYAVLQPELERVIREDMAYIARENSISLEQACRVLVENVDLLIREMLFSETLPTVHAALVND